MAKRGKNETGDAAASGGEPLADGASANSGATNGVPASSGAVGGSVAAASAISGGGVNVGQAGVSAAALLGELAQDVESFEKRRDELARRLAEEIAVTQARLDELKRTQARLFPTANGGQAASIVEAAPAPEPPKEERKPKKAAKSKAAAASSVPAKASATDSPVQATETTAETLAPSGEGSELSEHTHPPD